MRRLILRGAMFLGAVLLCVSCDHGHAATGGHRTQLREANRLIAEKCGACHRVPSVPGADGRVGPSLSQISRQQIIAGHFANTPEALTAWIEHPQRLLPGDAMPEMGLSHEQVREIVDYLYTME